MPATGGTSASPCSPPFSSLSSSERGSGTISLIVPAYNEEDRIQDVLRGLVGVPGCELIVVDDGSTDRTAQRAREAGARVVSLPSNMGKGRALRAGVRASTGSILVFLDGDVAGMTEEKLLELVRPVQSGALMCIGLRYALYKSLNTALPWLPIVAKLSGQRCVDRRLWAAAHSHCHGYGVESALNHFAARLGRIAYIHLPGLTHTIKESKRGVVRGLFERCKMVAQIVDCSLRLRLRGPGSTASWKSLPDLPGWWTRDPGVGPSPEETLVSSDDG